MSSFFPLYVKSTIDRIASDLAGALSIEVVDMDSAGLVAEMLDSDDTVLLWSIGSLAEAPAAPLWAVDFDIGVKTSVDPAQYKSLDVLSVLTSTFKAGQSFEVYDYTGTIKDPDRKGTLYISGVVASPSQPDRLSGIRLINVQARAIGN